MSHSDDVQLEELYVKPYLVLEKNGQHLVSLPTSIMLYILSFLQIFFVDKRGMIHLSPEYRSLARTSRWFANLTRHDLLWRQPAENYLHFLVLVPHGNKLRGSQTLVPTENCFTYLRLLTRSLKKLQAQADETQKYARSIATSLVVAILFLATLQLCLLSVHSIQFQGTNILFAFVFIPIYISLLLSFASICFVIITSSFFGYTKRTLLGICLLLLWCLWIGNLAFIITQLVTNQIYLVTWSLSFIPTHLLIPPTSFLGYRLLVSIIRQFRITNLTLQTAWKTFSVILAIQIFILLVSLKVDYGFHLAYAFIPLWLSELQLLIISLVHLFQNMKNPLEWATTGTYIGTILSFATSHILMSFKDSIGFPIGWGCTALAVISILVHMMSYELPKILEWCGCYE